MVTEDKPHQADVLKETYVLLIEAGALWDALRLYHAGGEDIPRELATMLEKRLASAQANLADVVNPFPF